MNFRSSATCVLVLSAHLLLLSACSDDGSPTAAESGDSSDENIGLVALGSLEDQGVRVTLHGPELLESGYTPFEVELTEVASGLAIERAVVQITPIMCLVTEMGEMNHGAPSEPPAQVESDDGCFENPVVLIMPGDWQLHVTFSEALGRAGSVTFNLDVVEGDQFARIVGDDGLSYFVALVEPRRPAVGRHDFELAIFSQKSMMSFPAVTDLEIDMVPTMPAMGHGSPENESPFHTDAGHYKGKVNFIMTGDWRLDLTLRRDQVTIASTQFDLRVGKGPAR